MCYNTINKIIHCISKTKKYFSDEINLQIIINPLENFESLIISTYESQIILINSQNYLLHGLLQSNANLSLVYFPKFLFKIFFTRHWNINSYRVIERKLVDHESIFWLHWFRFFTHLKY